jgi:hypothetical protein
MVISLVSFSSMCWENIHISCLGRNEAVSKYGSLASKSQLGGSSSQSGSSDEDDGTRSKRCYADEWQRLVWQKEEGIDRQSSDRTMRVIYLLPLLQPDRISIHWLTDRRVGDKLLVFVLRAIVVNQCTISPMMFIFHQSLVVTNSVLLPIDHSPLCRSITTKVFVLCMELLANTNALVSLWNKYFLFDYHRCCYFDSL